MENTHNFILPKTNLIGVGSIKDLPMQLKPYMLKKVLIVTDKNMIEYGYVEMIETILKSLFIGYDIFDGIMHPNPTVSFIEDGFSYFDKGLNIFKRDYSAVITIGGGTNHDAGNAIAVLATNGGNIADYEGWNKLTETCLPTICINTTAGSGAELSNFLIISDESRRLKMTLGDTKIMPNMSVNDPMFMTTMPNEVTASSGIDVVCHAIESYCSTEASPITDALAISSLKIAFKYLKRAYDNGQDLEARENMMYGNIMAGMAFNNAGLGYIHAISHQIGGFYNLIHGTCNAALLPRVLEFNAESVPDNRIFRICHTIGEEAETKEEAVKKIVCRIENLNESVNLPIHLKTIGVEEKDLKFLAANASKDLCALSNPRKGTIEDIQGILQKAM